MNLLFHLFYLYLGWKKVSPTNLRKHIESLLLMTLISHLVKMLLTKKQRQRHLGFKIKANPRSELLCWKGFLFFGESIHLNHPHLHFIHHKTLMMGCYNDLLTYKYFHKLPNKANPVEHAHEMVELVFMYNSLHLNLQILVNLFWANFQVQHEKYTRYHFSALV